MTTTFDSLGLAQPLLAAVAEEGYTTPTPIQLQAIPHVLAGRDVLAAAQTGTGKTAGFTLPLLQILDAKPGRPAPRTMRALILTPTRELAAQIEESVRTYGRHLKLRSTIIFGGVNINPQIGALRDGQDIVVATPGRLLDHVGQKTIDLSKVEILVLDEADRMLDMGFIHDIRKVLKLLPAKRQNLLFSATFSDEIRTLAHGILHDPVTVEVARRNETAALVSHVIHPVAPGSKRDALRDLIAGGDWQQVLVFTRMKHGANRLAEQLGKDGIDAAAIHGNKSQNARTKALAGFKAGEIRVLVATDIAARGLDIEGLPHVVNYELPNVPEDYVHRIGRTGRAGVPGHAVSLVAPDENAYLRDIERLLKRTLPREPLPGYGPDDPPRPQRNDVPDRGPPPARGRRPAPGSGARPAAGHRSAARPATAATHATHAAHATHATHAKPAPASARHGAAATPAGAAAHATPHVAATHTPPAHPHRAGHRPQQGQPAPGSATRGRGAQGNAGQGQPQRRQPSSGQGQGQGQEQGQGQPAHGRPERRDDARNTTAAPRNPARDRRDANDNPNVRSNLPPGWGASFQPPARRGR